MNQRGAIGMAIVRNLEHHNLDSETRHTEVECTYSITSDEQGQRFLQIDTYGSKSRKILGKKSQTIRFAPEAIEQLKTILGEHFSRQEKKRSSA
jgi:hypothetical protein